MLNKSFQCLQQLKQMKARNYEGQTCDDSGIYVVQNAVINASTHRNPTFC